MWKFIKYNNLTVIIFLAFLILGGSVFAAAPDALGKKEKKIQGVDNKLLLIADLENFNMDYKISRIEEDEEKYYVIYTYLDLVKKDNAWQYELKEKTRKVSKKFTGDLGLYLAGELNEEALARIKELKKEQAKAKLVGEEKRVEVTDYNGLIGKVLDVAEATFPGYEAVKKNDIPSPVMPDNIIKEEGNANGLADNLTDVYNNYIADHPELDFATTTSLGIDEKGVVVSTSSLIEVSSGVEIIN